MNPQDEADHADKHAGMHHWYTWLTVVAVSLGVMAIAWWRLTW